MNESEEGLGKLTYHVGPNLTSSELPRVDPFCFRPMDETIVIVLLSSVIP